MRFGLLAVKLPRQVDAIDADLDGVFHPTTVFVGLIKRDEDAVGVVIMGTVKLIDALDHPSSFGKFVHCNCHCDLLSICCVTHNIYQPDIYCNRKCTFFYIFYFYHFASIYL
jgi:hypothetical protein